jgi:hypothetical protein
MTICPVLKCTLSLHWTHSQPVASRRGCKEILHRHYQRGKALALAQRASFAYLLRKASGIAAMTTPVRKPIP